MAVDAGGARQRHGVQHHVLDRGHGQRGVPVEPDRPVPDEAAAVAVVAGEMVLGGWFRSQSP